MSDTLRRIAVIGGSRIPFCRSNTAYSEKSNMDMLAGALQGKLAAFTGKTVVLEKKTDPAVIGGVCVTLGDKVLDGTVRTNLDELGKKLGETRVH